MRSGSFPSGWTNKSDYKGQILAEQRCHYFHIYCNIRFITPWTRALCGFLRIPQPKAVSLTVVFVVVACLVLSHLDSTRNWAHENIQADFFGYRFHFVFLLLDYFIIYSRIWFESFSLIFKNLSEYLFLNFKNILIKYTYIKFKSEIEKGFLVNI